MLRSMASRISVKSWRIAASLPASKRVTQSSTALRAPWYMRVSAPAVGVGHVHAHLQRRKRRYGARQRGALGCVIAALFGVDRGARPNR